jgi:hypothetical protein
MKPLKPTRPSTLVLTGLIFFCNVSSWHLSFQALKVARLKSLIRSNIAVRHRVFDATSLNYGQKTPNDWQQYARKPKVPNSYSFTDLLRRHSWLSHSATSRSVAGSIPDGSVQFYHHHNPSDRTMAMGSTQPVAEMGSRNVVWGVKAAGENGWQPYHLRVPIV